MIQRWVASALVEAEKHFRRVRGYRDLQHLVVPWTRWLRPTAWLLTWRNIDDFVEETGSSPPEVQQRTGQPPRMDKDEVYH